jgi:hypothetical protein
MAMRLNHTACHTQHGGELPPRSSQSAIRVLELESMSWWNAERDGVSMDLGGMIQVLNLSTGLIPC